MAGIRERYCPKHQGCSLGFDYIADNRCFGRFVDGERRCPDADFLRYAHHSSEVLPCFGMPYLCVGFSDDRQFVDHDCHYRYRPHGYRPGAGIFRRLDCRCHHFRSLFRRQDFAAVRNYGVGIVSDENSAVPSHSLYDDNHRSVDCHHADYIYGCRSERFGGRQFADCPY